MTLFSPEKAYIFRIVHVDNLDNIFTGGLKARSRVESGVQYREIGNLDLIRKRNDRVVPVGRMGTLSDYVPFYFTPKSPMAYNIKTGYNNVPQKQNSDIAIMVTSLHKLVQDEVDFMYTDRHAYLQTANFYESLDHLGELAWDLWRTTDFKYDAENPDKMDRYQAEALIHRELPLNSLMGIVCSCEATVIQVQEIARNNAVDLDIRAIPSWYF